MSNEDNDIAAAIKRLEERLDRIETTMEVVHQEAKANRRVVRNFRVIERKED